MTDLKVTQYRELLVTHCVNEYAWTVDEALENVNEFLDRFMALKKRSADADAQKVSPSPVIDQVWHAALLYTAEYAEFCEKEVGFFVHHRPQGASEEVAKAQRYRDTHMAYTLLFGAPRNSRLWPVVEHTGAEHAAWVRRMPSYRSTVDELAARDTAKKIKKETVDDAVEQTLCVIHKQRNIYFRLKSTTRIRALTKVVAEQFETEPGLIRLLFDGRHLDTELRLCDYKIRDGDVVDLSFELKGC